MFDLSEYQWSHRPLLIVAPSPEASAYQEQQRPLAPESVRAGLVDRDMLVLHLFAEGESRLVRPSAGDSAAVQPLADEDAAALRDRFDVAHDTFAVILVGKDGTEKRRDDEPVTPESLFRTIDAMPMRQREMREDG
jgi:hypothetical protein